jgi:2-methylcitrate dehydratase PrpD
VAALAAKLMGLDVKQTRMALGNAASSMAGLIKNRGSDTKSHTAGNAAMHGVMAAELVGRGFTANEDIIDGNIGVARLLGLEGGDPDKVLDGLGTWHMATAGSTLRLHACCGAGHWSQDALQRILQRRPTTPEEVESIEVHIVARLMEMLPYHLPQTGLEAKYSLEYDVATILLDGRAGMPQYTDGMVQRPAAQALMQRVRYFPVSGDLTRGSRVVLKLKNGEHLEETVTQVHGTPADPLTEEEILGKFHECSQGVVPETQRNELIDLCRRLDSLENVQALAEVVGTIRNSAGC